jgi:class 3 adenylate cyclase
MPSSARPEPGRLLVVDDNKVNRLLMARGLQEQGHEVKFAENGRQALELLRDRAFDLVLLDIEMPEVDGFQVLRSVTSDPTLRHIPVVVASAMDELDSVVKCIEMGAEDYLSKPINLVLLKARVNASLEKKRLRDQQRELISRFATSEVAEDLLNSGFNLGGKLIQASVMFSDIRSFTSIVESHTPEQVIDLLNTYYTLMFDAISGHGGIVNQMEGDGLMAIFGAPTPHPDHRRMAVQAALEMVEMIEMLNQGQAVQGRTQLRIGVGIASGEVIAGFTGTMTRATYTCVGDTVNLAARLEEHTKVLERPILIDENTRNGLPDDVAVVDCGPAEIRGISAPAPVFCVTAPQTSPADA